MNFQMGLMGKARDEEQQLKANDRNYGLQEIIEDLSIVESEHTSENKSRVDHPAIQVDAASRSGHTSSNNIDLSKKQSRVDFPMPNNLEGILEADSLDNGTPLNQINLKQNIQF